MMNKLELHQVIEQFLHYTKTPMGQHNLEMVKPYNSKLALKRQLQQQSEIFEAVIHQGPLTFFGISDISKSALLAKKQGTLSVEELVHISRFLHGQNSIIKYYEDTTTNLEISSDLFESLFYDTQLSKAIDGAFSMDYEVYDHASEQLARIRKSLAGINGRIESAISDFMNRNSDMLSEQYSTIRNNRRVLPVSTGHKNSVKGLIHDQSASGQTTYIEPQFLIDLNNEHQDLLIQEHQEIVRICQVFTKQVSGMADALISSVETIGLLDVLFAGAMWAKEYEGTVAQITSDTLLLKEAYHPLLNREAVVKNSYRINPPHRMILITGPNTGGKTVGLKTIGLNTLLTLCGLPCCATEAKIPMVDQIFVDIGDSQSIAASLSTFSGHLSNLKTVLSEATPNSLVLLDELGSGTDPIEGESLAQAILEYLYDLGCFSVITTHFNRLKVFAKEREEILSSSVEFDMDALAPTYRYIEGVAGQSFALDIASKLDIKSAILKRAMALKQESVSEQELLLEKLENEIAQNQRLNDALREQQHQVRLKEIELKKKIEQIDKEKQSILKTFEIKQDQQLRKTMAKAKSLLQEMRDQQKPHESLETYRQITDLQKTPEEETFEPTKDLEVGDQVRILTSNQIGQIEQINKKDILVNVNGISIRAKANQLRYHQPKPTVKKAKKPQTSVSVVSLQSAKAQLNLIGQRVEEAMIELNQYLDTCVLNKMPFARIIHGHGTGALRKAVHETLKRHKGVKSYRYGNENEGGNGATVVEFK